MTTLYRHHATSVDDASRSMPAASSPTRVLLVDDHPAVRSGVRMLIDDQPDLLLIGEARSADHALREFRPPVDVALVDYHLGDGHDGLRLTAELKRLQPDVRVLVYSAFADGALAVSALIAGADGLLGKHELDVELCRAIRMLARGHHYLPAITPSVAHVLNSRVEPQDQAVFGMLLHGTPHEVITESLGIAGAELHASRLRMLRALRPPLVLSGLPSGSHAPLDYERARRRPRLRAA